VDVDKKHAAGVWAVARAHYGRLPSAARRFSVPSATTAQSEARPQHCSSRRKAKRRSGLPAVISKREQHELCQHAHWQGSTDLALHQTRLILTDCKARPGSGCYHAALTRHRGRTCQWKRSSPAGPALQEVGGSFCKSCENQAASEHQAASQTSKCGRPQVLRRARPAGPSKPAAAGTDADGASRVDEAGAA